MMRFLLVSARENSKRILSTFSLVVNSPSGLRVRKYCWCEEGGGGGGGGTGNVNSQGHSQATQW